MKALCAGWALAVFAMFASPLQAFAASASTVEAKSLRYMNRIIYTMRVAVAGAAPEQRAERALGRLRALPLQATNQPVERVALWRNDERVIELQLGGQTLLTVFPRDLDPDTGATLDEVAAASVHALEDAFAARRALNDPERLFMGVATAAAGIPVVLLVMWFAWRLRTTFTRRLQHLVRSEAATHRILGMDWSDFGLRAVAAATMGLALAAVALLSYAWVGHALRQFPATLPLAREMRQFLFDGGVGLVAALWELLPSLFAIGLVVLIARAVVWLVDHVFAAVSAGQLRLPGVHRETTRATRRLVVFAVWGLALTAAYPYIPGSDSAAFRGLSVFLGAMFTLGSSGVVSQWMHGLVIVYARALRVGDFVRCGDHAGVVQELGALSVKIIDSRGDEVTLPNGAVVQGAIVNHSRHALDGAVRGSVRLSLGYDVPWRRVHDLLMAAADRTDGVRMQPAPRVLDRVLGDFSIEYELVVEIDVPVRRAATLAALNRSIRDVFEEAGVPILSPHFVSHVVAPATMPLGSGEAGQDPPRADRAPV